VTRKQVETLIRRPLSDAEWLELSQLLELTENHPDADAILDRCIASDATIEELIDELAKRK